MSAADVWITVLNSRLGRDLRVFVQEHRAKIPYLVVASMALVVYAAGKHRDGSTIVYRNEARPDFKEGRIFGSYGENGTEGRDRLLSKTVQELKAAQTALTESTAKLQVRMTEIERSRSGPEAAGQSPSPDAGVASQVGNASLQGTSSSPVRVGSAPGRTTISYLSPSAPAR